ncbi:hypothetical protein GBO85_02660 [Pediococcus acidilactici]|uniref:YopX family protein n=1 Tax=Pediococcus acidilactici TaxID=1254 RepID=UPI001330700B|nr:YopX family protein [Pediococcus acidilactici]KAF0428282.1 hypothetical protein GBO85_02660 [Pediococcus acidilactici]MCT3040639.1 hypothetical protein [Pediococcus acidilactici]
MIKFRGIPLEDTRDIDGVDFDGTFVYGNYIKYGDGTLIVGDALQADEDGCWPSWWVPVDPKTVGQYTGMKDMNGKEIYEGDLVRLTDDLENPYKVIFDEAKFEFLGGRFCYDFSEAFMDYEVIGNIHKNPELLEESNE